MNPLPIISRHAIDRYRQRVEPTTSVRAAAISISEILHSATACSRPRHWMRVAATAPGTRYLYSADQPNVCLVVADGVVVTVHSRKICAGWRRQRQSDDRPRVRATPYERKRWTWLPEAA